MSKLFAVLRKKKTKADSTVLKDEQPVGIKVCIVFIHGLNGHRDNTWRHENSMKPWPEVILPRHVQNARIMTYGYDSRVADWNQFLGKVSINGIKQHAQNLLETLASRRTDEQSYTRAIIFVCHSLGGIICKDVLEQLEKDSEELERIQTSFEALLTSRPASKLPSLEVKCFFEERPTPGVGQVVDYRSATLPSSVPIGINKGHRDMTKFESEDDSGLDLIMFTMRRWIQNIGLNIEPLQAMLSPSSPLSGGSLMTPSTENRGSRSSSSSSSFVKIPPGGKYIINEKIVELPVRFIPPGLTFRDPKYFQPRPKEMNEISEHVFPKLLSGTGHPLPTRILIYGLGGVGKTDLSLKFVADFGDRFDAVFFLIADSRIRVMEQYSKFATYLGLVEEMEKSNQELCTEAFKCWLVDPIKGAPESPEARTTVKWLLVLDNTADSDILEEFMPASDNGTAVITTRNSVLAHPSITITLRINLRGFGLHDGAQLLRFCAEDNKADDLTTQKDAECLVNWLGGLPITIQQLGRIIYSEHLTVSRFLEVYPTKSALYARLDMEENDHNLVTLWALNTIHERQHDTFELLCLIALLDPECIEHHLLCPQTAEIIAGASTCSQPNYFASRKHLANVSLIEVSRDNQYRVECGSSHEAVPLLDVVEKIYVLEEPSKLEEEYGKLYRGRIALAVSSRNADDLLHYAQLAFEVEREMYRKTGQPRAFLAVAYNDLGHGWACQKRWDKAIHYLEESKKIRENMPGFTRDKLFSPLYHLGLVLCHQGSLDKAEAVLDQAIQDRAEAFGPDDATSTRSAALFYARGNVRFKRYDEHLSRQYLDDALDDHLEAMHRAKRAVGAKNRTTLICQYQVARTYARLGQISNSSRLLDEVISNTLDKPIYYRDILRISFSYSQCLEQRDGKATAESRKWLQKCLEVYNSLQPHDPRTLSNLTEQDVSEAVPYDYL
ncbi:hypothetical protein VPNG_02302 [Cytospora leucostoma]|uniref:Uncharacterized protein n=1 Tax=Cytospora leucostoma TaxID=1230097 RepID=A0A423XGK7_9PEZI|nr:hypothetical protein VPNG_02302 [Cytospora leucostoma]